jgi:hypothetical protein
MCKGSAVFPCHEYTARMYVGTEEERTFVKACSPWGRAMPTMFSCQFLQQCLRLPQVGGVKALGEPAVDRGEQVIGRNPLALALPEAAQAYGRTEFPRLCLLVASHGQGLLETGFSLGHVRGGLVQQQHTLEPIHLWRMATGALVHELGQICWQGSGCKALGQIRRDFGYRQ